MLQSTSEYNEERASLSAVDRKRLRFPMTTLILLAIVRLCVYIAISMNPMCLQKHSRESCVIRIGVLSFELMDNRAGYSLSARARCWLTFCKSSWGGAQRVGRQSFFTLAGTVIT